MQAEHRKASKLLKNQREDDDDHLMMNLNLDQDLELELELGVNLALDLGWIWDRSGVDVGSGSDPALIRHFPASRFKSR